MTVQELIDALNKVEDKSEKIYKDINGNSISTTETINILQSVQKDNEEDDEDYSYLNEDEYMSLGDIEDMMW